MWSILEHIDGYQHITRQLLALLVPPAGPLPTSAALPCVYTGYKGEDARRIWAAIYAQECFLEVQEQQQQQALGTDSSVTALDTVAHEKEVLYRLISGMHSSITTSIVMNFYNETSGTWGPNMPFFKARFASPAAKPYLENLYFAYLFVLRAVMKVTIAYAGMVQPLCGFAPACDCGPGMCFVGLIAGAIVCSGRVCYTAYGLGYSQLYTLHSVIQRDEQLLALWRDALVCYGVSVHSERRDGGLRLE